MSAKEFDVCVIGAGPGGYVSAIRLSQLGFKTVIIEKNALGGVCLNVGCIPSKTMIATAHLLKKIKETSEELGISVGEVKFDLLKAKQRKDEITRKMSMGVGQLLKGNQIEIISGEASFLSSSEVMVKAKDQEDQKISAKYFILATGSRPIEIPELPFGDGILSSTEALDLETLPKSLLVIGGGYIGLEISSYLNKMGSEVTIVENKDLLLKGLVDQDVAQVVGRKLKKEKVDVLLSSKVLNVEKTLQGFKVKLQVKDKEIEKDFEKILVTVGRRPNTENLNLKEIGVEVLDSGFIKVNEKRETSVKNIFAIGDIAGQPMLAHKASHEGVMVAEILSGKDKAFINKEVPAVMFTDPEISSVGKREEELNKDEILVGKFPYLVNGRAVSISETEGFIKVIADKATKKVLGVHIVGAEASNLISEAALAIQKGLTLEDILETIHPHPTLGEMMMEASEAALGHPIHMILRPPRK